MTVKRWQRICPKWLIMTAPGPHTPELFDYELFFAFNILNYNIFMLIWTYLSVSETFTELLWQ